MNYFNVRPVAMTRRPGARAATDFGAGRGEKQAGAGRTSRGQSRGARMHSGTDAIVAGVRAGFGEFRFARQYCPFSGRQPLRALVPVGSWRRRCQLRQASSRNLPAHICDTGCCSPCRSGGRRRSGRNSSRQSRGRRRRDRCGRNMFAGPTLRCRGEWGDSRCERSSAISLRGL